MKWTVIFVTLLLVNACSSGAKKKTSKIGDRPEVYLETFDQIANPGEEVALKMRLFDDQAVFPYWNQMQGEVVELLFGGKLLATHKLDAADHDIVFKTKVPQEEGIYVYDVRLASQSKFSASSKIVISVAQKCHPALIVDIDHTIADISSLKFLFVDYQEIPMLPKSQQVMQQFAAKFNLIYLTARSEIFKRETKQWLELMGFPQGPTFFWSLKHDPFFAGDYKVAAIMNMKRKYHNIVAGVGDKPSDLRAYKENGIPAIFIGASPTDFEGAISTTSWEKIGQVVPTLKNARECL